MVVRAVLDANVFASALISGRGAPRQIINRFLAERAFTLVVSSQILDEVARCIAYPRVRRYIQQSDSAIAAWLTDLSRIADIVTEPADIDVVAADPDDTIYLATAVAGRAPYLVTGDRHLLDMETYRGVQILRPAVFLDVIARRSGGVDVR